MKKHGLISILFLLLSACAHSVSQGASDVAQENWRSKNHLEPDAWTAGASPWFFSGKSDVSQNSRTWTLSSCDQIRNYLRSPIHIKTSENNRCELTITGDESSRAQIAVRSQEGVLNFEHNVDAKPSLRLANIELSIPYLRSIKQFGQGQIEIRNMRSANLSIQQSGDGAIYLSGNVNLSNVIANGRGLLTVVGARSSALNLKTSENAQVYLNGQLSISKLRADGHSKIAIMGASGQASQLFAAQDARVQILGLNQQWNISQIQAQDRTQLFLENINGSDLLVQTQDQSIVGVSGRAQQLTVNTKGSSQFLGMNLKVQDAFVRAEGGSHSNVWVLNKIFASSRDRSSIYYFGDPARLSDFTFDHGLILPMEFANRSGYENSFSVYRPYSYRKDNPEQVYFRQKGLHKISENSAAD